jgi:hypothetical protein
MYTELVELEELEQMEKLFYFSPDETTFTRYREIDWLENTNRKHSWF